MADGLRYCRYVDIVGIYKPFKLHPVYRYWFRKYFFLLLCSNMLCTYKDVFLNVITTSICNCFDTLACLPCMSKLWLYW